MPDFIMGYPPFTPEQISAKNLFRSFIENGFSYDELSRKPDFMAFASSYTLSIIFPDLITNMLERNDQYNFLIYGILTAIDPANEMDIYKERSNQLRLMLDKNTIKQICKLLSSIENDPPVEPERLQRIKESWLCNHN